MLHWIDENFGRTYFFNLAIVASISFLLVLLLTILDRRGSKAWLGGLFVFTPLVFGLMLALHVIWRITIKVFHYADPPNSPYTEDNPEFQIVVLVAGPIIGLLFSLPGFLVAFVASLTRKKNNKTPQDVNKK
jgi:hypothetical protein